MTIYQNKITNYINTLDTQTLSALQSISTEKQIKKGDYLLRQDEVCKKSFWIEKGVARKYYLHDGKDITTELYFENDLAVSFNSYCTQQPSKEFIQALSDCVISQTDYEAFQKAKHDFPKLAILDLMMTEHYAMWLEDRLFQLHTMDATMRYKKLLTEHTIIIQNVPLTYIASYLGISLETLSRIRAKK
jgi:CRP-like cAMP-binding protein